MTSRRRGAPPLALFGPAPVSLGLRRFLLRSVGPPAARFHPLDLDMVTPDGAVANRALCVLPNTGGKSTLLKLLSSVVNPGTAGLIGKGDVADMVLATDTSHVVLEWHSADGSRYVTGWAAEWAGLQKPPSGTKGLRQCWYTFRVGQFGVDDLPFEHEGRKVRWEEYRRQLRSLYAAHPGALGYTADTQADWRRTLAGRTKIDWELFRYQARMNAAESGAAALVTQLKTPEAVVGFFVDAFDDDARTAGMFRQVSAYISQAAGRATMETHALLCAALADALEQFRIRAADYEAAVDMEAYDVELRRELAGAVRARAAVEVTQAATAGTVLDAANLQLAATNRAIDGDEDRRKQYLYLEAEMRWDSALAAESEAVAAEGDADLQRNAWASVPAMLAHDSAVASHYLAKSVFDTAETELAPLRAKVDEAASRLVAGLHGRAFAAGREADAAKGRHEEARRAQAEAVRQREAAISAAAAVRSELQAGDAQAATALQRVADARENGDISPNEPAAEASERWRSTDEAAGQRRHRAIVEKDRATSAQRDALRDRSAAEAARREAAASADAASGILGGAATSASRLLAEPDVAAVVGAGPAEAPPHRAVPAAVAADAALIIDGQAAAVERSAQDTWADLRTVEAELDRLAGTELLDAGEDIARALTVLRAAHIGALTGWMWLAGAVPAEDRPAFIIDRPDIVNGVVVSDPARLDDGRNALEKAGLFPRLAVVVTTSLTATTTADGLSSHRTVEDRFVVDPHPGLYDKEKAEEEIARLEERREMLTARHADQETRGRELREAAGIARRHAESWPDSKLDLVETQKADAERAVEVAVAWEAQASTDLRAAANAEKLASKEERIAGEEQSLATAARHRLATVVESELAAARHGAARPGMVEQITRHHLDAELAGNLATDAFSRADTAAAERRESEQVAKVSRERAAKIGAPTATLVPEEPIHLLEADYGGLAERLANEAAGRDHYGTLERAEAAVVRTAEVLTGVTEEVLDLTRRLTGSVLAGTPDAIRAQSAAADDAWKMSIDYRSKCRRDVERWSAEVETHRPTDRIVHAVLTTEEVPADADDAARRASDLSRQLSAARALRDRQQAARDAAERTKVSATAAASAFSRLVSDQDNPVVGAEPYMEDVDSAFAALDQRRKAVVAAKELAAEAKLARQQAAAEVNNRANNRRWVDITNSLKELCATASADGLAEHGTRYLEGLGTREASLRADIADLDTHRTAVIDSLGQTCDQLRRSLQRVKTASMIPTKVFGVGGHQAIVIDFKRLPAEAGNAALSDVVDEWAASGADVHDTKTRQGRLMQALSATVERRPEAGRWSVKFLKPRIDGDVTYCTPDRVTREYSGGQELTLAVLLYCTLAAVRAEDRTGSDRPPGLLLLDNPFGAASSERLIHIQQELATAADVQLLCFTALSEPSILNGFNGPGTFRQTLRNDRDQRTGYQHVRAIGADATIQRWVAEHLAGPELEAGEESRVGGIAYQTKPPFPPERPTTTTGPGAEPPA